MFYVTKLYQCCQYFDGYKLYSGSEYKQPYFYKNDFYTFSGVYIKLFNLLLGVQSVKGKDNPHIFDATGKNIFNDERFLFDISVNNELMCEFLHINRYSKGDNKRSIYKEIVYGINKMNSLKERFVANVSAYFYYVYINKFKFYSRTARPFYKMSNFGAFELLNIKVPNGWNIPRSCYTFCSSTILRDTFFESQEFVHSFTFEMV